MFTTPTNYFQNNANGKNIFKLSILNSNWARTLNIGYGDKDVF